MAGRSQGVPEAPAPPRSQSPDAVPGNKLLLVAVVRGGVRGRGAGWLAQNLNLDRKHLFFHARRKKKEGSLPPAFPTAYVALLIVTR